ncbi:MAG: OprO/OprP family phosphate-selective porin [Panacagrimonas sp.]
MNNAIKYGALAVLVGSGIGVAQADLSETKGGVTIKTEDGRFEAKFGGRIHLDTNTPLDDDADNIEEGVGEQRFDAFFRRARLTLEGKAYGWTYKFENDFASQTGSEGSGFREMWIGTKLGPANLRLGQAKPYRGMEELTSSNEISFMERPFATATSIYGNRQYLTGVFLDGAGTNWGWGLSGYNLRSGTATANETDGFGTAARAYFAPVMTDTNVFHVGVTASVDNPTNTNVDENGDPLAVRVAPSSARFAGRSGPTGSLSDAATSDEQTTYGLELAGKAGPFYAQGEYAAATFSEAVGAVSAGEDVDVTTYYLQFGWLVTGETKPYDVKKGVFKSPKPNQAYGAWEAKFRYDFIELEEATPDREISQFIVGLNWFVNPAVRMMFEYISGENEPDGGDSSKLDVFATRIQFAF